MTVCRCGGEAVAKAAFEAYSARIWQPRTPMEWDEITDTAKDAWTLAVQAAVDLVQEVHAQNGQRTCADYLREALNPPHPQAETAPENNDA